VIIRQVCFRSPGLRSCLDCCSRGTCHSPAIRTTAIRTTARSSSATRVVTIPPVATFLVRTTRLSGLRTHVLYFLAGLLASRRSSGLPLPALSVVHVVLHPPFSLVIFSCFPCSVPATCSACHDFCRSCGLSVVCCTVCGRLLRCVLSSICNVCFSVVCASLYILAGSIAVASL
jgi:hypothetical protein